MIKNLTLKIFFSIIFLISFSQIFYSQTLYWTNSTGNNRWSVPANWSLQDPSVVTTPTPAVSPPTASNDVIFNSGSFKTATNHIINLDLAVQARSMFVQSVGLANNVTVNGNGVLSLYGGAQFLPESSKFFYNGTGNLVFKSNVTGNVLHMQGQNLETTVQFDGVGGGWQFTSPVNTISSRGIEVLRGSVDFNSLTYTTGYFASNLSGATRSLAFGTSLFNITGGGNAWYIANPHTAITGKPSINFSTGVSFYHQSTGLSGFLYGTVTHTTVAGTNFYINTGATNEAEIEEYNGYSVTLSGGTNTKIQKLNLVYGYASNLNGRRLITDKLTITGNTCDFYKFSGGSIAFSDLVNQPKPIDKLWLYGVAAQIPNGVGGYVTASPLVTVSNGYDHGSNTGWNITNASARNMYWIGNSGEWHNPLNWSLSSGGASLGASGCPPTIIDNVFFDANSFNANNQVLTIGTSIPGYCNNMTWSGLDQTGIDWQGTQSLNLGGDITLDPNMKEYLTFNQNINLYDRIEGRIDFGSGAGNRKMSSTGFYFQEFAKILQVSDLVYVREFYMARASNREYNVGGTGHTLQVRDGFRENGTIRMNDATIINEGSSTAVYYNINLFFNANSVWKSTSAGNIQHRFVSNNFPTFIQTSPTGTLNLHTQGSNLNVVGNLTVNGKIYGIGSANVSGTMYLSDNIHQFTDGNTITVGHLDAAGGQCGVGPTIKSIGATQFNLNVPNGNVLANYASISDVNYTGSASALNLDGQGAVNVSNNTNINFGLPVINTFYWRPNSDDNSYTGNWNNPRYWALNQSDTHGQNNPAGCVPSINDHVVFDNLSGNGSAVKVTISDSRSAATVKWMEGGANAVPNNMTFEMLGTGSLSIKEELTLANNVNTSFNGTLNFVGEDNQELHVNLKNKAVYGIINSNSGIVILDDGFVGSSRIDVNGGEFNTNGKNITAGSLWSTNTQDRKIDFTNSIVTLNSYRQNTGSFSGDPYYIWKIQNSAGNLEFISTNSVINMKGNFSANGGGYFLGDGLTYNDIIYSSADGTDNYGLFLYGSNTIAGKLSVQGILYAVQSFTVNKLNLKTDRNHLFWAGQTTTFLESGNIEKNGDLSAILNMRSNNSPILHNFVKASGGNIYVCNIGVIDIQATGVPFKTNSVSTYNGLAGLAASPPPGTSWDFTAAATPAEITFTDPADIHINLGDEANLGYQITLNNTGPYQTTIDLLGVPKVFNTLSNGTAITNGTFSLTPTATGDAVINDFRYFNCPGQYDLGNIIDGITPIKVPPVNVNGLALNGETETYPFKNLSNKIYVMNEADRAANAATFASRKVQVLVQDKVDASDVQSLNNVTVTTTLDGSEINLSPTIFAKRRWNLTTTGAGGAIVRFYITQAELTSLKTVANKFNSDLDFLSSLSVYKFNSGVTPGLGQNSTQQPRLSTGIATELADGSNIYYYVDAKLSNFTGSYALGTTLSPGGVASTIKLWLAADKDVTLSSGSNIGSWKDLSGTGNLYTPAGLPAGTTTPTLNNTNFVNFNPKVDFNGTNGLLQNTAASLSANNLYTVWMIVNGIPNGAIFSQESNLDPVLTGRNTANPLITADGKTLQGTISATEESLTGGISISQPSLVIVTREDTGSFNWSLKNFVNGTLVNTKTFTGELQGVIDDVAIGFRNKNTNVAGIATKVASDQFTGNLSELVVYGQVLANQDFYKVGTYLATKYGITLSHNYTSSQDQTLFDVSGSDSNYKNNITGIGRDDASAQNQLQSKSVNPEGIVTIGLGMIASSNATNTNSFANDLSFEYFGNDAGDNTWIPVGAPNNFKVLNRKWRISETGTVGPVELRFDVDDADFNVPNPLVPNYYIVYDSNNNNSLSDETPIMLITISNGVWKTSSSIDFNDNTLFTLATLNVDSDSDTLIDSLDLDDDNDGILDSSECPIITGSIAYPTWPNLPSTIISSVAGTLTLSGQNIPITAIGDVYSKSNTSLFSSGVTPALASTGRLDLKFNNNTSGTNTNKAVVSFGGYSLVNPVFYMKSDLPVGNYSFDVPFTILSNSGSVFTQTSSQSGNFTVLGADSVLIQFQGTIKSFTITETSGIPSLGLITQIGADSYIGICDDDNDGIPNLLELDSDNDGCFDAIEGAANNVTSTNLTFGAITTGGINITNGVPNLVGAGQGIGQSQDAFKNDCLNKDSDGYADWQDLDDDNDGILDTVECLTLPLTFGTLSAIPNDGTINSIANGSITSTNVITPFTLNYSIQRVDATGTPINIRSANDLNNSIVLNTDTSTNWTGAGFSQSYSSVPTFLRFNTRDNGTVIFRVTFASLVTNPVINISGTANRIITTSVPSSLVSSSIYLNGSGTTSTTATAIPNGATVAGNHQLDAYNLSIQVIDTLATFDIIINELGAPNIGIDNAGLAISFLPNNDYDGDGIDNCYDTNSDGDTCPDAIEGDENVVPAQLLGDGSINYTANGGLGSTSGVDIGVPILVNSGGLADFGGDVGQGIGSAINELLNGCFCYKPPVVMPDPIDGFAGITALGRAGENGDGNTTNDWPAIRKGAWLILESKTKGFVINRLTSAEIATLNLTPANLKKGMMVYNTTLDGLYINIDGTPSGWRLFKTQACPDN